MKNVGKTIVGGVKAVGKLVTGDAKGALKEIKETPLYKEGENLVKSVKTVGEGIVKGDLKKIGEGVLGVATNDLLGFIPGQVNFFSLLLMMMLMVMLMFYSGTESIEHRCQGHQVRCKRSGQEYCQKRR